MNLVGRFEELQLLKDISNRNLAKLVVCYGRRRIGKSVLIRSFGEKQQNYIEIQGLAPNKGVNKQDELNHFMRELATQSHHPYHSVESWREAFQILSSVVGKKKYTVLLDEISWMGHQDPSFSALLKVAWDTEFKRNEKLTLVLCGSVSSWISENILNSKDFMGRISLELPLQQLSIPDCNFFWGKRKNEIPAREKLQMLAVTGGVPRYLEEINPKLSAEVNIAQLSFRPTGILFSEFEKIFNDIFDKRAKTYKKIVLSLVGRNLTLSEICFKLKIEAGGKVTSYLSDLVQAGFLRQESNWNTKNPELKSKFIYYRISDNYLRFYLKYISPNRKKIESKILEIRSFSQLKGYEAMIGLQFESLILNNVHLIIKTLKIDPQNIIKWGNFIQRKTQRLKGVQIDLLIQTKKEMYICEMKTAGKIQNSIKNELDSKIAALPIEKGVGIRKVLIHCSEISEEILDEDYFDSIISFQNLLDM